MSRHTITAAAAVLLVAASTLATASPVQAVNIPLPSPGSTYVALGSSYAAGGNLLPLETASDGAGCGRSAAAYPNLVAQALNVKLVNATCGGATTANVTTTPQTVYTQTGLRTLPVQLDAVTSDTALVTITIGGNDVSYVATLIAESCKADLAANPTSPFSLALQQNGLCASPDPQTIATALGSVEESIADVVRAVQAKAPSARIVLVDYLTVLPSNAKPCAAIPIGRDKQKEILRLADGLSSATRQAARSTNIEVVAASTASRKHDACSDQPWVTGYVPAANLLHPNATGQAVVAGLVVRELVR